MTESAPAWDLRAFQIPLATQMERPDAVARILRHAAALGYNACWLYAEGALQYETHPEISAPWALTKKQFRELQSGAAGLGMDLVLVIPTLGHAAYIVGADAYRHLDETPEVSRQVLRCGHNQLCVSRDETYTLLADILGEWAAVSDSPYLHVGGDESWHLATCDTCRRRAAPRR